MPVDRAGWSLAALPGVGMHTGAIGHSLDSGFSCVWLVPDVLVAEGWADRLVDEIAARPDTIRIPRPSLPRGFAGPSAYAGAVVQEEPDWVRAETGLLELGEGSPVADACEAEPLVQPVVERLAEVIDPDAADEADPLATLAASDALRGRVVVVTAWEEDHPADVGSLLARLPALGKACGAVPLDRPRLLVVARERDLPRAVLERIDPVTTKVHWWWGVAGWLDTAIVVAADRRRDLPQDSVRQRVASEVLIEVAGPDLVLAARLARSWDGRRDSLADLVDTGEEWAAARALRSVRAATRPPNEVRDLWNAGMADLWDGKVRISPRAGSADLANLVWRGQHRALGPVVDDGRARLAEVVHRRASMAVIAEITRQNGDDSAAAPVLELGGMAWAVATRRVRLSVPDRDLLMCLRDTRNLLAHVCALSDAEIDRVERVLGAATAG